MEGEFNGGDPTPGKLSGIKQKVAETTGRIGDTAGKVGEIARSGAEEIASRTVEIVQIGAETVKEKGAELTQRAAEVARDLPQHAENSVLASRQSRLTVEAQNTQKGIFRRALSSPVGQWVLKPVIEFIPGPFAGYGPGDAITGISAIAGTDILTGDKLDNVNRVLYGIATAIPFVPSGLLVGPAKLIRKGVEEAVHTRK